MVRNARHLGFASLILLVVSCTKQPPPDKPDAPIVVADAGSDAAPKPALPACEQACARMAELGCKEGQPTPAGKACKDWLCEAEKAEIIDFSLACLAKIKSCDEIDTACR